MVILVKDERGADKAIDLGSVGWTGIPVVGQESIVELALDTGEVFNIDVVAYDNMKRALIESGKALDLTGEIQPVV